MRARSIALGSAVILVAALAGGCKKRRHRDAGVAVNTPGYLVPGMPGYMVQAPPKIPTAPSGTIPVPQQIPSAGVGLIVPPPVPATPDNPSSAIPPPGVIRVLEGSS